MSYAERFVICGNGKEFYRVDQARIRAMGGNISMMASVQHVEDDVDGPRIEEVRSTWIEIIAH